jgi:DNA (cytosine-5)-methyltransferase 1
MNKKIKLFELFSGIGSQAMSAKKVFKNVEIVGTSEWDIKAIIAYALLNNKKEMKKDCNLSKEEIVNELSNFSLTLNGKTALNRRTLSSLPLDTLKTLFKANKLNKNYGNIKNINALSLPNEIDILTYSFPCQDLSNVGALHGYKDGIDRNSKSRSSLLWEVERILFDFKKLKINMPRVLLMENVQSLLSKRHSENFNEWKKMLESLGYSNRIFELNAIHFGIPQNRKRVIMVSFQNFKNSKIKNKLDNLLISKELKYSKNSLNLKDYLRTNYDNKLYFEEALASQPNKTISRDKIWELNLKILDKSGSFAKSVATITTRQDRHPNSGNIYFKSGRKKSNYRFLTARECFLLMGLKETDFDNVAYSNIMKNSKKQLYNRDSLYKLAGNSIVIDMLESVFYFIEEVLNQLN